MRAALVNHRDWLEGGMDKVALTHLKMLQAMGHEAVLFAQYHPKYNINSRFRQYFPHNAERLNYRFSWNRLHHLPQDIGRTLYNPVAGKRFGAFLDDFKPDVVHVHGLLRSFSPAIYDEAKRRGIPLVQTHHYAKLICPTGKLLIRDREYCRDMHCIGGNVLPCIINRCQHGALSWSLMSALELGLNRKRYVRQPDIHLAPSRYLKTLLAKAGVPQNRLHIHPNFVDTRIFQPDRTPNRPKEPLYFLYFGRLAGEKGIETLLDAFAPLYEAPLYLIGNGPLSQYCQERIAQENLTHIRYLGPMDERQLVPWIQQARATLIPSLWGEIFGLTILESLACACPVIGSQVGAIPELIRHGENGFLVPPGDAEALRNAVVNMALMSPDTICAMGEAGLAMVQAGFTLEQHMETLLSFYQQETGVASITP